MIQVTTLIHVTVQILCGGRFQAALNVGKGGLSHDTESGVLRDAYKKLSLFVQLL
jgi:hypothetical protein